MKKTLLALTGIFLLTGCPDRFYVNKDLDFYQIQKQESFVKEGYIIIKQETYTQRKVDDVIKEIPKEKGVKF